MGEDRKILMIQYPHTLLANRDDTKFTNGLF